MSIRWSTNSLTHIQIERQMGKKKQHVASQVAVTAAAAKTRDEEKIKRNQICTMPTKLDIISAAEMHSARNVRHCTFVNVCVCVYIIITSQYAWVHTFIQQNLNKVRLKSNKMRLKFAKFPFQN